MLPQLRRGGGVLFVCLYVRTDMSIQMHTCSPDRYTNSSMAMLSISWEKKRGWRWRVRDWHCTALPLAWLHSAPGHHPSIQQQPASIPSTQLSLSPFHTPPLPLLLATWLGLSAIAARDSRARYTRPPWHTPLHIHLGPRHTASALSSALALAM